MFAIKVLSTPTIQLFQVKQLLIRYVNMASSLNLSQKKDLLSHLLPQIFVKSKRKKINSQQDKKIFELIFIFKMPKNIQIFKSFFVVQIQNI